MAGGFKPPSGFRERALFILVGLSKAVFVWCSKMETTTNIKMVFRDNNQTLKLCYGILSVEKRQWEWLLHKSSFQHYHGVKTALQVIEKRLLSDLQNLRKVSRPERESKTLPEPQLLLTQREMSYWINLITETKITEESLQRDFLPREKVEFCNNLSDNPIYLQTRQVALMQTAGTKIKGKGFAEALKEILEQLSICLGFYEAKDFEAFLENSRTLVEISGALLKCCLAYTHHFVPVLATVNDRKSVAQTILEQEANFFLGYMDLEKSYDITESLKKWINDNSLQEVETNLTAE